MHGMMADVGWVWERHSTRASGSGSDFDNDQSRSVYLVRLNSIWYCNWFMLFMTLDMPDEGTR